MKENIVTFELAKLLKEHGFNRPTEWVWYSKTPEEIDYNNQDKPTLKINKDWIDCWDEVKFLPTKYKNNWPAPLGLNNTEVFSAPSINDVIDWLREEKDTLVCITMAPDERDSLKFSPSIFKKGKFYWNHEVNLKASDDYKSIVESAVTYALQNLENHE